MYIANIYNWHRPWWQPKLIRKIINHFAPYADDAARGLSIIDQMRSLFGLVMGLLLLTQFNTLTGLCADWLQITFKFNDSIVSTFGTILLIIWVFGFLATASYTYLRHARLGTFWSGLDFLSEIIILPFIMGASLVLLTMISCGLWMYISITSMVGTLLLCLFTVCVLEYIFSSLQWQFYYQKHVSSHPGYQDSLL